MPISPVSVTPLAGDSTLTLTNGSQAGRAVVIAAYQSRSSANITGFSIDGVNGTTVGQETDGGGTLRTLVAYWSDADLPATAGDYPVVRLPDGTTGGTEYVAYEFTGVTDITQIEVISSSFLAGSTPVPLDVVFSTSNVDDFLGISYKQFEPSSGNLAGGTGQTDDRTDTRDIVTRKIDAGGDQTVTITGGRADANSVYTAFAVKGQAGPAVTITDPVIPGTTTTFSTSGFVDPLTGVRITDAEGNVKELTLASQTSVSAPAVGDLDYALFGDVTLEVYNATESAEATIAFDPPAGFSQIALEAGFATDQESFLYQYGGTPAVPDQFTYDPIASGTGETLTLQTNGYWTATGYGEWTVYGTDATDGYMEPFTFTWSEPTTITDSPTSVYDGYKFSITLDNEVTVSSVTIAGVTQTIDSQSSAAGETTVNLTTVQGGTAVGSGYSLVANLSSGTAETTVDMVSQPAPGGGGAATLGLSIKTLRGKTL